MNQPFEKVDLTEKRVSGEEVFSGRLLKVFCDQISLANGKKSSREYIKHNGAVCIVPIFSDGTVLIEEQFRYPMGKAIWELPAGKLDSPTEDPNQAAKRELYEECGLVANELVDLGIMYPTPAYSTEIIHLYATVDAKQTNERKLDYSEQINLVRIKKSELLDMVRAGKIPDAKTQAAVLQCILRGII